MTETVMLYHGTSALNAVRLLACGWAPGQVPSGSQCGDPARLYLTTLPEDAAWFAARKEDGMVLELQVPRHLLRVDPEDRAGDTVEEEFAISARTGLPAKFTIAHPIGPEAFAVHLPYEAEVEIVDPEDGPEGPSI
ncbi:hypothetical protein [Paracoccus sp. ME4]|uniref:hypothetical protein n=1 Tax=Paracoccus sp. ME4 TaxID=3138066 RepID=UPI00398B9741